MNVSVLGCGRWGSFLAWYQNKIGHNVTVWGLEHEKIYQDLEKTRKNEYVAFSDNVTFTSDLNKAVSSADAMIISISSQALRSFMQDFIKTDYKNKPIILCMKGIEISTGKRLSEVVCEYTQDPSNVAVWVGPGHIQCFVKNIPNCMIIASQNVDLAKNLINSFKSDLIKFYLGKDMLGCEVGAAAKNVIGIAAGMLDGAGLESIKGALMARGAREVSRLIKAMGGDEFTAYGLSHLGDYETTLFSPFSNNKRFGEAYIKGEKFDKLAEGVKTAEGMMILAEKYNVELPITKAICTIINEKKEPMSVLLDLFSRTNQLEF